MIELFKVYKLYVYVALGAILAAGWLFDRHTQYKAGIAYCTEQLDKANTKYTERKEQENQKAKEDAVQDADKAAKQIASLEHEKEVLLKSLDSQCALSGAEWLRFNETISRLQGQ